RRGSMYDPLIVDTFVRVHHEIVPDVLQSKSSAPLIEITSAQVDHGPARPSDELKFEATGLRIGTRDLDTPLKSLTDKSIDRIVSDSLHRITSVSLSILFVYDAARDELAVGQTFGENGYLFKDLRIPRGQRLSGWVAANRQPIINSDPVLDLGEAVRAVLP